MKQVHRIPIIGWATMFLALVGCQTDAPNPYILHTPSWFPTMEIPADNQLTQARVELGRKLFYEPLLSSDSTISCGSCHQQEKAFSDGKPIAEGVNNVLGLRNAPTLANVGYAPYFFQDGGVETLEMQAQQPIFSKEEMNFSIAGFLARIEDDETYITMSKQAYNRPPSAYTISRALAAFQRTFMSANTRYDQYQYQGDKQALSEQELRGKELFFSERTQCASCHKPPLFTNFQFENVGLYQHYADSGRARITHTPSDRGRFKVPTLRNIALTAPYMHNGSMQTLEQVVAHFNQGGVGHANQSEHISPLHLTETEQSDLVAFLHTLTDSQFIENSELSAP